MSASSGPEPCRERREAEAAGGRERREAEPAGGRERGGETVRSRPPDRRTPRRRQREQL